MDCQFAGICYNICVATFRNNGWTKELNFISRYIERIGEKRK